MSLLSLSKKILSREGKTVAKGKAQKKPLDKTRGKQAAKKEAGTKTKAKPAKKKAAAPVSLMAARVGLFPILSEKSVRAQERNTIMFRVLPAATKHQISMAVQERYGVRVLAIRTSNMMPKVRRRGLVVGRTKHWKKAYVTVDNINPIMQ